ncbi:MULTISPECIES: hypothetical protein [Streptomyces]|uniref:hypothetical protein n=1 Tax=Streptomyces TaxID=1883 RepID=UPI00345C54E6
MSARITLHCDQLWKYGSCPRMLITDAVTLDEARRVARAEGWRTVAVGDFCPGCSGTGPRPGAPVVLLHPQS